MKHAITILTLTLCLATSTAIQTFAQGSKARYSSLISQGKYDDAITEGIAIKKRLGEANENQAMFDMLREMDKDITDKEKASGEKLYRLRYRVQKERMMIYLGWHQGVKAKAQFNILKDIAGHLTDDKDVEEWLLTKALFYNTFGTSDQCTDCYKTILARRRAGKSLTETEKCFNDVIELAKERKNASVNTALKAMLKAWQDSIATEKIAEQLRGVQKQYDDSQAELADRESSITGYKALTTVLAIIAIVLGCLMVFFLLMWWRCRVVISRLTKSLTIANENNSLKSEFIANISGRITPLIDNPQKLRSYLGDIETYSALDDKRDEKYEKENVNVGALCEEIITSAKPLLPADIDASANTTKMSFKTNSEVVKEILTYIIKATAKQQDTAKITLEFKKRSAHTGEFVLVNHGGTLDENQCATIFTAFKGEGCPGDESGLGYPICTLKAFRLDASLHIDNEFRKGTRFVLKVTE